jgi:hypothetical protein
MYAVRLERYAMKTYAVLSVRYTSYVQYTV